MLLRTEKSVYFARTDPLRFSQHCAPGGDGGGRRETCVAENLYWLAARGPPCPARTKGVYFASTGPSVALQKQLRASLHDFCFLFPLTLYPRGVAWGGAKLVLQKTYILPAARGPACPGHTKNLWGRFVAFWEEWPPSSADRPPSPVPTPRLALGFARTLPKTALPASSQAGLGQPGFPIGQAGTPSPRLPASPFRIPIRVPILANAPSNTRCKNKQCSQYS